MLKDGCGTPRRVPRRMTEREQRPGGGQQSGGTQPESERRQWEDIYSDARIAADYGIPREAWNVPAVRLFLDVNRRVRVIKAIFRSAESWGTEPEWARSIGPEGTLSLEQRFVAISALADVMDTILKDGFKYHNPAVINSEAERGFLADTASRALEAYGLKVVDATGEQGRGNAADGSIIDASPAPGVTPRRLPESSKDR